MAESKGKQKNSDHILSMKEAYLLADLVVLSSCGKLAKGKGMMAMNRVFFKANCK